MKKLTLAAAALCVALGGTVARAQDAGALLDLMVKKRLITDQEAEEVRSELVKESASTAAGKWKLSTPITEIELYGDVRLRYEYRGGRLPSNNRAISVRITQMIGMSAIVNDIASALASVAHWLMIGFLGSDWKRVTTPLHERDFRSGLSRPIRKIRRRSLCGSGIFRLHGFPGLQVNRRQNATAAHNYVDAVGRRYQSGRPRGAMEAHVYFRPWRWRRRSGSVLQQGRL